MSRRRVLVLGGYGVFGGRLTRLLAKERGLELIVAGRRRTAAEAFCAGAAVEGADTILTPAAIPDAVALRRALRDRDIDMLVNCVGPYQEQDYTIASAAIAAGAHYVDLADGRAFVAGFGALDAAARAADVLAVTGASTLPGLSAAAVDALGDGLASIDAIAEAIAPGMRFERGDALVRAILGYAGQPFTMLRDGAWRTVHGWQDTRSCRLRADGRDTGRRWLGACDVPDLALFPQRYPGVRTATFHAGLEVPSAHFGLWALSWLVRARLAGSLVPLSGAARRIGAMLAPLGSGSGGMFVDVSGTTAAGRRVLRRWTLIADSGDGPWVPVLPALLVVRGLLDGAIDARGARPCVDLFGLADIEALAGRFNIVTERTESVLA